MKYTFKDGSSFRADYKNGEIHIDEFREEDHPRGKGGKFVSKGGEKSTFESIVGDMENDWINRMWDDHKEYTHKEAEKARKEFKQKWVAELNQLPNGTKFEDNVYLGNGKWEHTYNTGEKDITNTEEFVQEYMWNFEDNGNLLNEN